MQFVVLNVEEILSLLLCNHECLSLCVLTLVGKKYEAITRNHFLMFHIIAGFVSQKTGPSFQFPSKNRRCFRMAGSSQLFEKYFYRTHRVTKKRAFSGQRRIKIEFFVFTSSRLWTKTSENIASPTVRKARIICTFQTRHLHNAMAYTRVAKRTFARFSKKREFCRT